jgi:hypothetical protein
VVHCAAPEIARGEFYTNVTTTRSRHLEWIPETTDTTHALRSPEIYHDDISEEHDLAAAEPERVAPYHTGCSVTELREDRQ